MFTTVRITRLDRAFGGFYLGFVASDQDEFQQVLQRIRALPTVARRWEPDAPKGRAWWVSGLYIAQLYTVFPGLQLRITMLGTGQTHQTSTSSSSYHPPAPSIPRNVTDAFETLYLIPSAPPAVVSAAYRALAKVTHPDAGGSTQAMQRLNAAYEVASEWAEKKGRKAS